MRYLGILTVAALMASCTTSKQIVMPSGDKANLIECGGTANKWSSCYEKAGELCPSGYDILDRSEERGMMGNSPSIDRTLIVNCKK